MFRGEHAECVYYVCAVCGYIERYVADSRAMSVIRQEWTQVDPDI